MKWLELLSKIDDHIDNGKQAFVSKMKLTAPVIIEPYRGFGNQKQAWIKGRVLTDYGVDAPTPDDTKWDNFYRVLTQYVSNEQPNVEVQATLEGQTLTTLTDKEGYFEFNFELKKPLPQHTHWHEVQLSLPNKEGSNEAPFYITGEVLIPASQAEYGIISDIDDTVLVSNVTDKIRKFTTLLSHNAHTRKPFEGVTALYQALQNGINNSINPLFFVSGSSWNIFSLLTDFMEITKIQKAPLMLRDFGIDKDKFIKEAHLTYKPRQINKILSMYPYLKFILIGDSGQHDAHVYEKIIRQHPGRILAVYIRNVSTPDRAEEIKALAHLANEETGTDFLLVKDSEEAARHAAQRELILWEDVRPVVEKVAEDHKAAE